MSDHLGTKGVITIYKCICYKVPIFKPLKLECYGQGIKGNPFIVNPTVQIPKTFYIIQNRSYIHFKNINANYINFDNSSYIIPENCKINRYVFYKCSEIKVINSKFKMYALYFSSYLFTGNCFIKRIKEKSSIDFNNTIVFEKCQIKSIRKNSYKKIIFEKSKIDKIYTIKAIHLFLKDYLRLIITSFLIVIISFLFSLFLISIL